MNALSNLVASVNPRTDAAAEERAKLSEIDHSFRGPALLFTISSVLWLMLGTVFALIASWKMHSPDFLNVEWLTFGRARSVHLNAMAYGWATNVGFAVALWIMARLCRAPVRHAGILVTAGIFWNVAVTIGVFGISAGDITSVEWLEMPTYVTPILAISYALIGVWGMIAFRFRANDHVYVSQWYILAALFWFPWLYTVAQIMIFFEPARGTVQALTNWWFAHNVLGLWLTPLGLAAAYYLIPKVLGKPIHSYYLSVWGFWTLALFYNWAGVHHLIGGPVPAWVISVGTVASVMMTIPVIVTAINHHATVVGEAKRVWVSPTLRFVVFGSMSYTLTSLAGSTMALRSVNEVTHFTQFTVGHAHHGVYAFYTMVMFGALYFMMPRLLRREWPSALLIRVHFFACAIGIGVMIVALHVGGWIQGLQMNNPDIPFDDVVKNLKPWLLVRSLSGILLTIGHVAFALNLAWMIVGGRRDAKGPTLLGSANQGQEARA